jgi:hypothetical protein
VWKALLGCHIDVDDYVNTLKEIPWENIQKDANFKQIEGDVIRTFKNSKFASRENQVRLARLLNVFCYKKKG